MPGNVRNDDVAQKKALCSSATNMQLGSECHPGSMGFVKEEFLAICEARAGRMKSALEMALRRNMTRRRYELKIEETNLRLLREVITEQKPGDYILSHCHQLAYD